MARHGHPPFPPPGFPSRSAPLSCVVCAMYSYDPDAFDASDRCGKCTVFEALSARLSELERALASGGGARLPHASQPQRDHHRPRPHTAADRDSHKHDGWVTARTGRKHSNKRKANGVNGPPPLHVSNPFSPLADVSTVHNGEVTRNPPPTKRQRVKTTTLIIGSSIMRNVKLKTPGAAVKCIPGARSGDIESYLKLLNKNKATRYDKIVIHCGGNDTRLRKSELTKINVESVCTYAKTMSDNVVFSGPLPNMINDDMYSRMSSFHRWLSRWCPENNVGFINHWQAFEGKNGLIARDGIHPTWDGAKLISRNVDDFIATL